MRHPMCIRLLGGALLLPLLAAGLGAQAVKSNDKASSAPPTVRFESIERVAPNLAHVCLITEDAGGGVGTVQVIGRDTITPIRGAQQTSRGFRTGVACSSDAWSVTIPLVPGLKRVEAVAYSSDGSASSSASGEVSGQDTGSTLHILTVGIDSYRTDSMRLQYARADARAFADSIARGATPLYRTVRVDSLFDAAATKEAIEDMFLEISQRADTNDTFVFFFAGHGVVGSVARTGGTDDFFLVPVAVTDVGDRRILAKQGISVLDLQKYLEWIPTHAKLIVLDACQSGALVQHFAKNGSARSQLREVGTNRQTAILAATGPSAPAREVESLQHGLFTAALLQSVSGGGAAEVRYVGGIADKAGRMLEDLSIRHGSTGEPQELWQQLAGPRLPLIFR